MAGYATDTVQTASMDAMEASHVEAAATLRRNADGTGTGQVRRLR